MEARLRLASMLGMSAQLRFVRWRRSPAHLPGQKSRSRNFKRQLFARRVVDALLGAFALKHGSLFSGIGGIDLGFEAAGIKSVWQVESDQCCLRVLTRRFPQAERFDDVRKVGKHNLQYVDVISGGIPCQPFSSASRGRKSGTADARFFWPEMLRIVTEIRPSWICIENVTQFDGVALEQVASDLERIDYQVGEPLEIPACAVGCDHRRQRIWILCHTDRNGKPGSEFNAETSRLSGPSDDARGVGAAHGISKRMDRMRMLGNSVIPLIAENLAKAMLVSEGN